MICNLGTCRFDQDPFWVVLLKNTGMGSILLSLNHKSLLLALKRHLFYFYDIENCLSIRRYVYVNDKNKFQYILT